MNIYHGRWHNEELDIYTEDKKKIKFRMNCVFNAVIKLYNAYDNDIEKTSAALEFADNDMDRAQLMLIVDVAPARMLSSNVTKTEYLHYNFLSSMIGIMSVTGPLADLNRVVILDVTEPLDHVFNQIL